MKRPAAILLLLALPAGAADVYIGVSGQAGAPQWTLGLAPFFAERGGPEAQGLGVRLRSVVRDDLMGSRYFKTVDPTPGADPASQSPPATVGPVLAAAGGESFAQLYREFATAVSAQNTSAATPPYQFSSAVVLRGNVDVPSVRPGAQSTRHLGFGGPQPPETFTNNLPTGFLTLGPGVTATTFILDGGILYLPSANGPSGNTISVSIPSAPSLEGSLIQGTLPTPPPTST